MKKIKSLVTVALTACLAMSNSLAGNGINGTFTLYNNLGPGQMLYVKYPLKSYPLPIAIIPPGEYRYEDGEAPFSIAAYLLPKESGTFKFATDPGQTIGSAKVTLSGESKCTPFNCYRFATVSEISVEPGYRIVQVGTPDKVGIKIEKEYYKKS